MKNVKGFTLAEVLMVVVVIGILAAIFYPRVKDMPEKSIVAEANQTVGALLRAQRTSLDQGNAFLSIDSNTTPGPWQLLGLQVPGVSGTSGTGAKFNYICSGTTCTASRPGQVNKWVTLTTGGTWSCGTDYTIMVNGGARWVQNS